MNQQAIWTAEIHRRFLFWPSLGSFAAEEARKESGDELPHSKWEWIEVLASHGSVSQTTCEMWHLFASANLVAS